MAYKIGDTTVIDNNRALTAVGVTASTNLNIPSGNTAGRPTGAVGKLYFDTDLGKLMVHNGSTWIIASSAGEFDQSAHNARYTSYIDAGDGLGEYQYRPVAYNEALQAVYSIKKSASEARSIFIKLRGYDTPIQIAASNEAVYSWCYPASTLAAMPSEVFPIYQSLSLDNKAISINTQGSGSGINKLGATWLFDSDFPGSGFVMQTGGNTSASTSTPAGIYKYSPTEYVTWTHTGYSNVATGGHLALRKYNPNNVVEGQAQNSAGAYPVWGKQYGSTNGGDGNGSHNMAGSCIMGVWKSATANQLTVMYHNNKNSNAQSGATHPSGGQWKFGFFDINMNTGSPVGTSFHEYFTPTTTNTMPSALNFSVCECSTHVTFITWADSINRTKEQYWFWIWDKANRNLRRFYPEVGVNTSFNSSGQSQALWMWHFKMNDKIYCCVTEKEPSSSANATRRWTNIYETSATGATRYMVIYNDANNHTSPGNRQLQAMVHPQHGTDSFQWSHLAQYAWEGSGGLSFQGTTALRYYVVTTKPELSKTSLGANFTGVTSANWTGTAPTMTLNADKVTSSVPTWSVLGTDLAQPNNNSSSGWSWNMMRKTFFNGNIS
tara:strand:- start:12540 stop:14357 length:1818 start_codon:yes stop_codon:yes gene_type:complete